MTELKDLIRKSLEGNNLVDDNSRQSRINFFKEKVEDLYRLVNDNLLADLREENLYQTTFEDEEIIEEGLGKYNIRTMLITMGRMRVELRPYGTEVIGARGRIDMWVNNNDESAMLILVPTDVDSPKKLIENSNPQWVWKMVERKISKVTYQVLTSDIFQKKILSLASLAV